MPDEKAPFTLNTPTSTGALPAGQQYPVAPPADNAATANNLQSRTQTLEAPEDLPQVVIDAGNPNIPQRPNGSQSMIDTASVPTGPNGGRVFLQPPPAASRTQTAAQAVGAAPRPFKNLK